jgi:hypothetical protein
VDGCIDLLLSPRFMSYQIFTDDAAQRLLAHNSMRDFDGVWSLETVWFEAPNDARGGWSGASRVVLDTPEGGKLAVFLKRQENHRTHSWRAPFGVPTFRREYENIRRLRALGIPAVPALYYGEAHVDGGHRAAIITVAMDDYLSLDVWLNENADATRRQDVLKAIADWTADFSRRRLQHGCLYDKHILVRKAPEAGRYTAADICFIDLEKMRRRLTVGRAARSNIDQLVRRSKGCTDGEHRYLQQAFGVALAQA